MVRVCPYCSNVDVEKLKEAVGEENVKTGCVGMCRAYKTESVGKIDGEVVIKQTEAEFIEACKK
ncbi:DUF1450 domain-containing protein [Romboutsia weinsteinii]|uniref:DUF1450 domain-containing protein n=1 Tax=Romboutsia weinsteinii TaxID=2020949 RepID=A0A371J131_9FIRM|nr:DUF1450 domain-containing protein [Romboutsia weinsteinii]RDY26489.1 DUF1450 domain-containing protein [Romboutsia weinsteinii]